MAVSRSSLGRSPAYITINGTTFYTRADFLPKHSPVWQPVNCTLHGQINKYKKDFVIRHSFVLFGAWANLSTLFPSYLMNPSVGTNVFGTSDQALVINAKNNDVLTYPNARITKVADLYLGVDDELFAAAVEVTCLIKNNTAPETAGAYFTRSTGSYSETAFDTANFLKTRWTASWGSFTGLTGIISQKGFRVAWTSDLKPDVVDGYGTVSMYIGEGGVVGAARFIPIGGTLAQWDGKNQAAGAAMGVLLGDGTNSADFVITGASSGSVTLKNAGLVEDTTAFGIDPLEVNEKAVETSRLLSAGVPSAVSVIS